MRFGERFAAALKVSGLTQREAAHLLDLSQQSVAYYCGLESAPKKATVEFFARALGVKVSDLTGSPLDANVREAAEEYQSGLHVSVYMDKLKRRWHHKGAPRDHFRVAIALLWPDDADKIIAWLEEEK
jgi:transcriptional regulator with XRE-family HTH domain